MRFFKLATFIILVLLSVTTCEGEIENNEEKPECEQLVDLVEECMGLHEGALDYIDSCGSLSLDQAKSFNNCDDLLDYFGIYR